MSARTADFGFEKLGKDNLDAAVESFAAYCRGLQAIASEAATYSKRSLEEGAAAAEKMMGAGSIEKALEVQVQYLKASGEGMLEEAGKLGEMYAQLARETCRPYEAIFGRPGS